MAPSRRTLLLGGAALLGASVPFCQLLGRSRETEASAYGPLLTDPNGILDLPRGFTYRVLQRAGETMSDGYRVPASFDGMACFAGPRGSWVLLRNHENTYFAPSGPYRPGQKAPREAYSAPAMGGVTRLVVDASTLSVVSSNLVLAGTLRNCAGGPTPWGYVSCEETSEPGHGYAFLCRTGAERVARPERLDGYGRFRHEAVAFDEATCRAYLTEDREDGCLYRFVPHDRARPFEGRLEALTIEGHPGLDTTLGLPGRAPLPVKWVPLPGDARDDDRLRLVARDRGAALVCRGEGIWLHDGQVVFCATSGGRAGAGQVFRLTLDGGDRDHLELLAEATDTRRLNMPDNVTLAPWGDIVLAEDSITAEKHLRVLTPEGLLLDLARNAASRGELAGVCFSPDARILFVNLYGDGLTLAIQGPFRRQRG